MAQLKHIETKILLLEEYEKQSIFWQQKKDEFHILKESFPTCDVFEDLQRCAEEHLTVDIKIQVIKSELYDLQKEVTYA